MRAIRVHEFGTPETLLLEDVPDPVPGGDELLVRVLAAGVNPVETYVRSGAYATLPDLPYTPGSDAAGVIVETGERVFVTGSSTGTYAELSLCRREHVHPLPGGVSFAQGAALGVPYATAYRALFQRARAAAGETVLVHGASGGVGLASVQFALAAGLRVIGTAGSEAGSELVAAQGPVTALDHRDPAHLEDALAATGGRGVDVVVEARADVSLGGDLPVLAAGGRVVVVGSRGSVEITPRDLMARDAAVLGMLLKNATAAQLDEAYTAIAAGLRDGSLRPAVGLELPLAEAARAHHLIMEGPAAGKIVLVP